jgi:hypothetical protein
MLLLDNTPAGAKLKVVSQNDRFWFIVQLLALLEFAMDMKNPFPIEHPTLNIIQSQTLKTHSNGANLTTSYWSCPQSAFVKQ